MADELTPEEKLLKVIQQGGKPVAATVVPRSPVAPTPLPLSVETMAVPVSSGTAALGIALLRRVLTAATVALIALVIYELYRNIPEPPVASGAIDSPLVSVEGVPEALGIAAVTDRFDDRRITGIAGDDLPLEQLGKSAAAWIGQLHKKYKFMAISEVESSPGAGGELVTEAIVLDKLTKTIQFIRSGQFIQVGGKEVLVKAITEKAVEFELGSDSMTLSAGTLPQ
jgi:hypothetical protein